MLSSNHYIPGVCNIGPAERSLRQRTGWGGLVVTVILAGLFFGLHAAPGWRLLLFFPATASASGFFQSAFHFCLGFGFKSVFNFGQPGKIDSVEEAEFRTLDRHKAQKILVYAVLVGLVVALGAYWLK